MDDAAAAALEQLLRLAARVQRKNAGE